MNYLNKALAIIFIFIFCLLPNVYYSSLEVTDSFLYPRIAISEISLDSGRIVTADNVDKYTILSSDVRGLSETPLLTSLLVIIGILTGLSLKTIQFIPICGILSLIICFSLAYKVNKSIFYSLIFLIYFSYEPVVHSIVYSVFTLGWALLLYFVFLIVYLNILSFKNKKRNVLILLLLFISAFLSYYTLEMYMIVFALFVNILLRLKMYLTKDLQTKKQFTTNIPLIFIIIFMIFDNTFYRILSQSISNTDTVSSFRSFIHLVHNILYASADQNVDQNVTFAGSNAYALTFHGIILNYTGILLYLTISLPIILHIASYIIRLAKSRKISLSNDSYLFPTLIVLTGIFDVITYSLVGFISFKYVLYIFPLVTLYLLKLNNKNDVKKLLFIILFLGLVFMKFYLWSSVYMGEDYDRGYETIDPMSSWFFTKMPEKNCTLISDLVTSEKLNAESTFYNCTNLETILFNSKLIEGLTRLDTSFPKYDYMALNRAYFESPTRTGDWTLLAPLNHYISFVDAKNTNFNLIYNDGRHILYSIY